MSEWPKWMGNAETAARPRGQKGEQVVLYSLAQQLYEALKETGGVAAEMIRSELHLKPGEKLPPVAARTEAALARYEREVRDD